jgi:cell division protein FtsQ
VTVTEREPVAVVDRDGQRTLVDASGVPFETVTGDPPRGVVPLDVPHPARRDPATVAALAAVVALPAAVRADVTLVTATSGRDVTLRLTDGTTVVWGDGEDAAAKGDALAGVLQQIRAGALDGADTIDVSAPKAVVLR